QRDVASAYPWQNARTDSSPLLALEAGNPYHLTSHSTLRPRAILAHPAQNRTPANGWPEILYSALLLYRPAASNQLCQGSPAQHSALCSPALPGAGLDASKGWARATPGQPDPGCSGDHPVATPLIFACLSCLTDFAA